MGTSSCLRRQCPNCWETWTAGASHIAARRLWAFFSLEKFQRGRVLHVTVSLPEGGLERKDLYAILKAHGAKGGVAIGHPWRGTFDRGRPFPIPKDFREGKHWHAIVYVPGGFAPGSEDNSYFIKVIKDAKYHDFKGMRTEKNVRSLLRYELGHAGVHTDMHALSWFGEMSYRNWKYVPEVADLDAIMRAQCPHCGSSNTRSILSWEFARWDPKWWGVYDELVKVTRARAPGGYA